MSNITGCDRCPATERNSSVRRMFIVTGRGTTAAGSTEDEGANVDLCHKCCMTLLADVLAKRDYAVNAAILRAAQGRK